MVLKRLMFAASLGAAVLAMGTGCSNKSAAERDSLAQQNKSLNEQLAAEKARADAAEARANASTTSAVTTPPDATPGTPSMEPVATTGGENDGGGVSEVKNKYGQQVIQIQGDVLFDSGQAKLKPAAKKSLDKVAAIIKQKYAGQMLRIEGHTDPTPVKSSRWDDNWDLGNARARAVLMYLMEKGVAKKNVYLASFADNDLRSAKDYKQDRRVDIVVTNSGK